MMHTLERPPAAAARRPGSDEDALVGARATIWALFDAGLLDEDHATAALLAISLGVRRMQAERSDGAPAG